MEIFEVLSDPTRRRMVELLSEGDRAAGELAEEFEISQPAVSRHLRVLKQAGVATSRVDGTRRIYSLEPNSLEGLDRWLDGRRKAWEVRLAALQAHLSRDG